jgi:flagellar motor switch protein FliN/FliY
MDTFAELLERWIEEFGRAVEMFTGEKPELKWTHAAADPTEAEIAQHTWWKQVVDNGQTFSVWAGGKQALWNGLGEGAEAQATYFEMLSQANQGTVAVFSAGFPVPLRCQDGFVEAPVTPLQVACAKIRVTFRDSDLGTILLLVDKAAFAILNPAEPSADVPENDDQAAAGALSQNSAMLSRLLDLRLPVCILLGRANITIKDALKLIPGSVVELDRQVGDYVEILVHGTVVAKGEIVSVKGNYGVRIKEVISRQARMALHEAA